jgi:hypothetical protein
MVNMKNIAKLSFVVIGFDLVQNTIKKHHSDNGIGFAEELILKMVSKMWKTVFMP